MIIDGTQINSLPLAQLREHWASAWGTKPHLRIGRSMLERSLLLQVKNKSGHGLTTDQNKKLKKLITTYKRNPNCFDKGNINLKAGTKLVREWRGKKHIVTVTSNGFSYNGEPYTSLSTLAFDITGSRWNGWLFFGLKK